MRLASQVPVAGMLGIALLATALAQRVEMARRPAALTIPTRPPQPAGPTSPSEAALRRARWSRMLAQRAANQAREALEVWDQEGTAALDPEAWRLELMARDQAGELRRAQTEAERAAALAHSPEDSYRAAELLTLIHHDLGHHAAELEHARHLIALQPDDCLSQILLRRALRCGNGSSRRHGVSERQ